MECKENFYKAERGNPNVCECPFNEGYSLVQTKSGLIFEKINNECVKCND